MRKAKPEALRRSRNPQPSVETRGGGEVPKPTERLQSTIAQVILDAAGHQLGDRLFSYVVPAHLACSVKVGSQVLVPFGHSKPRHACVVAVEQTGNGVDANIPLSKLKEILDVVSSGQLFDEKYLEFLQSVADYYMAPMSVVIAAALPPKARVKNKRVKKKAAAVQQEDVLPVEPAAPPPVLTADQKRVYAVLEKALDDVLSGKDDVQQPWLLHGVTGSGKTEIYLRLIARTLAAGRTALLMVPEISLTPQLAQRLKERFGKLASVWHSGLSAGERYDTWCCLKNGQVKILLGARSAIFADMPNLGLIVLDEEHDGSYKQSSPAPRYNARYAAVQKAVRYGAMVLLGSATPDMVSLYNARQHNRLLNLPKRVARQSMPGVKVVDMRLEFQQGHQGNFSRVLQKEITDCLERGEQAILLMNRRGFAQHVFCKACGFVMKCRHCSVCLVLHRHDRAGQNYLKCHHCGYSSIFTPLCPGCGEQYLEAYGLGTQRVEHELNKLFPAARVLRLDGDIASKKGAYENILTQFAAGDADILVGTQIIAKGLDIPKVTVVGVLAADAAFNLPDYRSYERGFQLLMQVAGRAGRGDTPGTVILQTYNTDLPALKLAQAHDYETFAEQELLSRQELEYPPYSQLIRVVVSGVELIELQAFCERLAEDLSKFLEEENLMQIKILGPAPCLLERIKENYRYHLLVKNMLKDEGRKLIAAFLQSYKAPRTLTMTVDVDAVDLL